MKVIQITHPQTFNQLDQSSKVLALGYFDGVHIGHQKVITTAKEIADQCGYLSAVMTFYPHPSVIVRNDVSHRECISSLSDKENEIRKLGIDILYIVRFSHIFSELLPQQFVDQYIIDLNVKHVVAGFDYTYGRLGQGTMETLPFHSRNQFSQTIVEKVAKNTEKISSTLIREKILAGSVHELPLFLGRYYTIGGTVVHGEKRGRTIGFPTANIELVDNYILPSTGIYAVRVYVNQRAYHGVLNIGYKPTFHKKGHLKLAIEVHIFDFNDSIYEQTIEIEWHKKLREEKKFESVDQLISQIQKDKAEVIHYFSIIGH